MNWQNKRVLITGINGFIGNNLAYYFLKKGAQIVGVDNFSYIKENYCKDLEKEGVIIIHGDVSNKNLYEKLVKFDIDYIFHFGAPSSIILFKRDKIKCFRETVEGMINIMEFAQSNNIKKVIYPSSGSVYSGTEQPHSENKVLKPKNLYAAAKLSCENIASSYFEVNSVGLRIFAGYGPGEERKGDFASVVYLFLKNVLNNEKPIIWGDGNQKRDFIYIEDVINAIVKSAESDFNGIINVGSGRATSFKELLQIISEIVSKNIEPVYIQKPTDYVEELKADTTLMEKVLKIKITPLEEGIKKFYEYLKNGNSSLSSIYR